MVAPVACRMALRIARPVGDQHVLAQPLARRTGPSGFGPPRPGSNGFCGTSPMGGDQIVVQILGCGPGDIFLHQRHADALGDAPSIWPSASIGLMANGRHSCAAVMRRSFNRAEAGIDLQLDQLRAPAIDRVGLALAVFIQRFCRRIRSFPSRRRTKPFLVHGKVRRARFGGRPRPSRTNQFAPSSAMWA